MVLKTTDEIVITKHAMDRAKRRMNIRGVKKLVILARKALRYGIDKDRARFNTYLVEYIKKKYQKYYKADNIRVYGHFVYIFKKKVLVTILELPSTFRKDWNKYSKNLKQKI